jgi:hypothetical protein
MAEGPVETPRPRKGKVGSSCRTAGSWGGPHPSSPPGNSLVADVSQGPWAALVQKGGLALGAGEAQSDAESRYPRVGNRRQSLGSRWSCMSPAWVVCRGAQGPRVSVCKEQAPWKGKLKTLPVHSVRDLCPSQMEPASPPNSCCSCTDVPVPTVRKTHTNTVHTVNMFTTRPRQTHQHIHTYHTLTHPKTSTFSYAHTLNHTPTRSHTLMQTQTHSVMLTYTHPNTHAGKHTTHSFTLPPPHPVPTCTGVFCPQSPGVPSRSLPTPETLCRLCL